MCLFPLPNNNHDSLAYKNGITEFKCGACPECMRERSNIWALRAVFESRSWKSNLMITLTYDKFKLDDSGNPTSEELPVDPTIRVDRKHIQNFIKRLRKYFKRRRIKYICCSEYGTRTHRAHYHLLLFNVDFPDIHYYKKSKRGNPIYMSKILTNLWNHGICTIDSINVKSAVARYCTKYCAKYRSDDTFMLASQRIGFENLFRSFNGRSYFIDGREYPVPRFIWQEYITQKYSSINPLMSYKYVNKTTESLIDGTYEESVTARRIYQSVRNGDPLYQSYIAYWQNKSRVYDIHRLPVFERIIQLPEKFHKFKVAALRVFSFRNSFKVPFVAPGSNCKSQYRRFLYDRNINISDIFRHLPYSSRPNTASDTISNLSEVDTEKCMSLVVEISENPLTYFLNSV